MSPKQFYCLFILAAIWGSSFTLVKLSIDDFGAIPLMSTRISIAAIFLIGVSLIMRRPHILSPRYLFKQQLLWPLTIAGVIGQTLPFALIAYAQHEVSAGNASIINATTPFWSALIAFFWLRKQLTIWQVLGMLIGFFGVFYLLSPAIQTGNKLSVHTSLGHALIILIATFAYGLGANYIKRYLNDVHPLDVATGSTIAAALCSIPLALATWPDTIISHQAWLSLFTLGIVCTGMAYLLFFYLIANVDATSAVSVTFLVPVFGVLWGWLFLHEAVDINTFIAISLIVVGIILSNQLIKLPQARGS